MSAARVVQFPLRAVGGAASAAVGGLERVGRPLTALSASTLSAAGSVDDWGRDQTLVDVVTPLTQLRWRVSVGGIRNVPDGGALLVSNHRRLSMSTLYASLALSRALQRPVRFAGRPDIAPLGPALRRLGGVLADAGEVQGALRAGELVLVAGRATGHPRHAGEVAVPMIGAAVKARCPVLPVATMSSPMSRGARVEVGAPVATKRARRGPLAETELAEATQRSIQRVLDAMGGTVTGVAALDWLGEG